MKWVERMLRAQVAARTLPEDQRPMQMLALAQTLHSSGEAKQGNINELEDEAVQLLTELVQKYGDKEYRGGVTFGELAKSSLFELESLSVEKTAPDIEGEGLDIVKIKLSDSGTVTLGRSSITWKRTCFVLVSE